MNPHDIANYLCQKALEKYKQDIGVITLYGSFAFGTNTQHSDLDMYAIVDNDSNLDLNWSFIYNGLPVE